MSPPFVARMEIALAASMELPPPMATIASAPAERNAARPRPTVSIDGFGSTPSKTS